MLGLFESLNREGLTVVVVTHDQDVAGRAHRRIAFRDGKVVQDDRSGVLAS